MHSLIKVGVTVLATVSLALSGSIASPVFANDTPLGVPNDETSWLEVTGNDDAGGSDDAGGNSDANNGGDVGADGGDNAEEQPDSESDITAEDITSADTDADADGGGAENPANDGVDGVDEIDGLTDGFSLESPLTDGSHAATRSNEIEADAGLADDLAAGALTSAAANTCAGQTHWMLPGCSYGSTFADPTVVPVVENGKTVYYAYGTTTSQLRLPVLRSTDLKKWYPHTYSKKTTWRANNFNFDLRPWPVSKKYDDLEQLHPGSYYNPRKDTAIPAEIRQFPFVTKAPQGNSTKKFQLEATTWYTSDGLVSKKPAWATDMGMTMGDRGWNKQENWAPGVAKIGATYFAYTSLRTKLPGAAGAAPDGAFCIAVATSQQPGGPFRYANGGNPVQCQPSDPGGAIDPEPVQYAGKWYLLWKGQGRGGVEQGLYAQPINTKTGALTGSRVTLLTRSMAASTWEQQTIENPSMIAIGGISYLTYSGGDYHAYGNNTSNYATGYAVCPKGPTAPCQRPSGDNRILRSSGSLQGPGGGSLFATPNGGVKLAYHAYTRGGQQGVRSLRTTNIYKVGGRLIASSGAAPIFADVPANHKFAKQIKWLSDRRITTGDKNGNFRPGANVSRSDMAAFLYRYAGSPAYTPRGKEPFADVNKKTKFYKEIRWMHATGLTTGVRNPQGGKPSYAPDSSISREAMAAFLYRLSGTKNYTPRGAQPLVDITPRSKFYREIRWMYDNKITTGIQTGTKVRYDEHGTTKRDAFAAFLMRYDAKFGK